MDPKKNVIITVGASEALHVTLQAHTNPGDEWILIEPALTQYRTLVKMAGGVAKFVQLRPVNTFVILLRLFSFTDWL